VLKKAILTLSLLLAGAVLLLAENIGEIVYFEGEISIQRDTSVLTELDIDFGEGIQNYDLVTTGPNSYVEIELFASTGIAGTIKMDPGSAFYLEISELRAEQVGNVELLAGRLNFQIDKMAGSSGFEVRTQAAVMGVRGTTFSVITAPQGEILVTTREGRVEVSDSEGSVSYAQPGQVVEASEENPIQTIPATVDTLEGFEKNWVASRIEAFRGNAPGLSPTTPGVLSSSGINLNVHFSDWRMSGISSINGKPKTAPAASAGAWSSCEKNVRSSGPFWPYAGTYLCSKGFIIGSANSRPMWTRMGSPAISAVGIVSGTFIGILPGSQWKSAGCSASIALSSSSTPSATMAATLWTSLGTMPSGMTISVAPTVLIRRIFSKRSNIYTPLPSGGGFFWPHPFHKGSLR
jgi:hypothetical protein